MNIFFAINRTYIQHLCVAMTSILVNNPDAYMHFNVISNDLDDDGKRKLEKLKKYYDNFDITYFEVEGTKFENLKLNIGYISQQTYYRYIIPELVSDMDKALYLDADLIVNQSLKDLWETNVDGYYAAGVRDTYIKDIGYAPKIGFGSNDLYINAGVLLLNLKKIREDDKVKELFDNTQKFSDIIEYQDQDIINMTFKNKIKELPLIYNYTFRDVISNSKEKLDDAVIVHFTGNKKPWDYYFATGNPAEYLYFMYLQKSPFKTSVLKNKLKKIKTFIFSKFKNGNKRRIKILGIKINYSKKRKNAIKVGLLVDEFFGGAGTAFGGYGFLARHYIAKYIPCHEIEMDLLLGFSSNLQKTKIDNINAYRLPKNKSLAKKWLKKQKYDVFLSVELTSSSYQILKLDNQKKRLVLWVQDPRPWYEWREINTVKLFPETCYWDTPVYEYVNYMHYLNKVRYITQGYFLEDKARDLYRLNNDVTMQYLPNPISTDNSFNIHTYPKKNHIIFLGRIESVKRGWLFCEIAQRLPEYEFFVLGQTFREKSKNSEIMNKYKNIKNLHFIGHVEGEEKNRYIKDAKILVNTSIHEALPISFLEALSFGTLLVSNRNPENLTSKFGIWVGTVLGDGFDKIDLYVNAIRQIINNDEQRQQKAFDAIQYIKNVHNVEKFVVDLRNVLLEEANR